VEGTASYALKRTVNGDTEGAKRQREDRALDTRTFECTACACPRHFTTSSGYAKHLKAEVAEGKPRAAQHQVAQEEFKAEWTAKRSKKRDCCEDEVFNVQAILDERTRGKELQVSYPGLEPCHIW
jgi:hypothetical protein